MVESHGDSPSDPAAGRQEFFTQVARGLAHEIKNPLSTMAIQLTLLEEELSSAPEPSPRDQRCLKRVGVLHREVAHLESILEDFLRFARGGQINRAPEDLVALTREVLDFTAPQHQSDQIVVHADLPHSLPLALIDREAIRRVVLNLLVNARQAMPGGGELIFQLARDGVWAVLRITDTGVGMDEEQLAKCFEMYWSTKKGGTGLGLSTVQRTVMEHGGTVDVVSEPGRGTSFTLRLPLVQELAGHQGQEDGEGAAPLDGGDETSSNATTFPTETTD